MNTAILETVVQSGASGPGDLNSYPVALSGAPVGTTLDSLGYSSRMCGSYVAWMVTQAGQQMPTHTEIGVPGYWPSRTVIQPWIVTVPQPGDIAVVPSTPGLPGGHGLYVCWVQPGGDLVVKSYDGAPEADQGNFAMQVWAPSGVVGGSAFSLVFIRFPVL